MFPVLSDFCDFSEDDFDPAAAARDERKKRIAKNEKQTQANLLRAQKGERKDEIERTLLTTKGSTASMGK
jgi:regulator of ribosome biosynthesis